MTSESTKSFDALYVWVYLPDAASPVVAGRLDVNLTPAGNIGRFNYGQSYFSRVDAIPIDPVALPLTKGSTTFTSLNGFPGAILDASPDAWGKRVIDRLQGKQANPVGYLLFNDPGRAGCLAFSRQPDEPPAVLQRREFDLDELLNAAQAVEADKPADPELLKALNPGSGGARPKCNIVEEGVTWIAKFPSLDDRYISIPRLEHAAMMLAKSCGVDVAETQIRQVAGKDVCLVRRFDRSVYRDAPDATTRRGFLSARTVFYDDPAYAAVGTGSYQRLSRWMPRFGASRADQQQLFLRMVFNVVMRNDDDHEQNHGLVHLHNDRFRLAPAYDIVQNLQPRQVNYHALLIGGSGAGTVANLVSVAEDFALSKDEALSMIQTVEHQVLNRWRDIFYEAGFGDEDIRKIEAVIRPIPIGDDL